MHHGNKTNFWLLQDNKDPLHVHLAHILVSELSENKLAKIRMRMSPSWWVTIFMHARIPVKNWESLEV